ncbi:MAG: hypothetical protein K9I94_02530 [Bacteroidales bacterium]|nr:hypothetical protein [Bacteroidales bacterium]
MNYINKIRISFTILLVLSLVVNHSCTPVSHMELMKDPAVLKVFNKKEIASLELIVNFFDSFILEKTEKDQGINQSYYQYFETIKNSESIEDLRINIGLSNSNDTRALIKKLKNQGVFCEIWKYSYGYDFKTKDTISVKLELNQQGKYMQLLEVLGRENTFLLEYYNDLQNSGTISPGSIAQFLKYYRVVDFQKEVNRMVFAVHYITIVSEQVYRPPQ